MLPENARDIYQVYWVNVLLLWSTGILTGEKVVLRRNDAVL